MPLPTTPQRRGSVTLTFTGIVVRAVTDFDIQTGSEFVLSVENAPQLRFEDWFFNNDPVLYVLVNPDGKSAKVKATGIGSCVIDIKTVGQIKVGVFGEKATKFKVTPQNIELKK